MQNAPASEAFDSYGCVYNRMTEEKRNALVCQSMLIQAHRTHSQFLHFSCEVYLESQSGSGILLVSTDPERGKVEEFPLSHRFLIKPNIYFALVAKTTELTVNIYVDTSYSLDMLTLPTPHSVQPVLPRIRIREILGYCYRIRTPGCRFEEESHPFFELIFVDTGILHTQVDGTTYTLGEKEMMLFGPGQIHRLYTDESHSVSYVTVLFQMENLTPGLDENWHEILLDRVYPYNKKTYTLIKTLVQESANGEPFADSLVHSLLTETVIRLLQSHYDASDTTPASVARQNYRDELFERIINYVESKIYEPLTIADICQQFSISRSSLQLLFRKEADQSPKKYISDMKLERSRRMLRENKYTVSEISLRLGYSSIHYFSNAFTQKYHISPSEYAKRLY